MRKYYKAYYLKDLRQFNAWVEKSVENEAELSDDAICYIRDDFVVVSNPVRDKEPIFDHVTPAWQEFCIKTLQLEIPEDLSTPPSDEQESNAVEAAAV